jgi:hypothetical protein
MEKSATSLARSHGDVEAEGALDVVSEAIASLLVDSSALQLSVSL